MMTDRTISEGGTMPAVAGLGLIVLDEQMVIREQPAADTKIFAESHRTQIGGPVPTALAQVQRFGIATRFLGVWGTDPAGRAIEDGLTQTGIEFDTVVCRTARSSGLAHVWIESTTGRRTIVSAPPQGQVESSAASVFSRGCRVLHLDGWGGEAAIAAAESMRRAGGLVTFDSGSIKPTTSRLLPLASTVNVPRRFLRDFCGTSDPEAGAASLRELGPRLVTVTDGEHGAGVYTQNVSYWRPAFPVRPVDTCGAGDVFCGGLIYALLAGFEAEATLMFAMATAALKITRLGNGDLAAYDEVVSFLEQRA